MDNQVHKVHRISAKLYLNYDLNDKEHDVLHNLTCFHKNCWNPEHLHIGTHADNMRDSWLSGTSTNQNKLKTHCKNGHEFTPENTYNTNRGKRLCKICESERNRKQYAETKANLSSLHE